MKISPIKYAIILATLTNVSNAFSEEYQPNPYTAKCGPIKIVYFVMCKKGKEDEWDPWSNCKMPQTLEFFDINGKSIHKYEVPLIPPKDIENYKKAEKLDQLYEFSHSCVDYNGQKYFHVNYWADGNASYSEAENFFDQNAEWITDSNLKKNLSIEAKKQKRK